MAKISDKQLIMPVVKVVGASLFLSIWISSLYHDDINIQLHNKFFFYIPINNNNTPQLLDTTQMGWIIFIYSLITISLCLSFAFLTKKSLLLPLLIFFINLLLVHFSLYCLRYYLILFTFFF